MRRDRWTKYHDRLARSDNRRSRYRRKPRRRLKLRLTRRRSLGAMALVLLGALAMVLVAGTTGIDQSSSSSAVTSQPTSPSPATSITPQTKDGSSTTSLPSGLSANSSQSITSISQGSQPTGTSGGSTPWSTTSVDDGPNSYTRVSLDAISSTTAYMAYMDVSGSGDELKFAKTTDGGSNWSTSVLDAGLNNATEASLVAPASSTIFIAYQSSSGDGSLKFARSTDGGVSFASSTVPVDAGSSKPAIAAPDTSNVYIAFHAGNGSLKFLRSTDGGDSFLNPSLPPSPLILDSSTATVNADIVSPASTHIFVTYYDTSTGKLMFNKSTDSGASFDTSATELDSVSNPNNMTPGITSLGTSTVYIVYWDVIPDEETLYKLMFLKSTNGGSSFDSAVTIDSNTGGSASTVRQASITAVNENTLFVSYYDPDSEDLKFARSTNGGSSWSVQPSAIDTDAGTANSIDAVDNLNMFVGYFHSSDFGVKAARTEQGGGISKYYPRTSSNGFTLDTDADGSADDRANFVLIDLDGDYDIDRMEVSTDDTTFGEGSLYDSSTGSNDDERFNAASWGSSTTKKITLGIYTFNVNFLHYVGGAPTAGGASASSTTWYTGNFTADTDADGNANDAVYFAISDTDSNGVYDQMDISTDDSTFGETDTRSDPAKTLTDLITGESNDEAATGTKIRLGNNYTFDITFQNNPGSPTSSVDINFNSSTWYVGSFTVNGSSLSYALIDSNSDGVYDTLNLDVNGNGSYGAAEIFTSSPASITVNGVAATVSFSFNPGNSSSLSLAQASSPDPVFLDTDSDLLTGEDVLRGGEARENELPDEQGDLTSGELESLIEDALNLDIDLTAASGEVLSEADFIEILEAVERENDAFEQEVSVAEAAIPPQTTPPTSPRIGVDPDGQHLVWDEVVITLDFDVPDPDRRMAQIATLLGGNLIGAVPEARLYQLQVDVENQNALTPMKELVDRFPGVLSASRHLLLNTEESFGGPFSAIPNDTAFSSWNVASPGGNNWNMEIINAPAAWDITTGDDSVIVAVIDGDMDAEHADLKGNVLSTFGPTSKIANGHGTHVSGIICAEGNNGIGLSGVAWDCSLRLVDFGAHSSVRATEAMMRAVAQGARIINLSLQWVDNSQCGKEGNQGTLKKVAEANAIFTRAIEFARLTNRDVLWVVAAGNECRDARFAAPASLVEKFPENVIVVGSIDEDGGLSSFSNFGELVDVAAPGGGILSTLPRTCSANEAGEQECTQEFGVKAGTSMAAPHVSGLAALIRTVHPTFTAAQVKACIVQTAERNVPGQGFKLINAPAAVNCGGIPSSNGSTPVGGGG